MPQRRERKIEAEVTGLQVEGPRPAPGQRSYARLKRAFKRGPNDKPPQITFAVFLNKGR